MSNKNLVTFYMTLVAFAPNIGLLFAHSVFALLFVRKKFSIEVIHKFIFIYVTLTFLIFMINFFQPWYRHSIRDFIVIFSIFIPLLPTLFYYKLEKIDIIYVLKAFFIISILLSLIGIFQFFKLWSINDLLITYYSNRDVDVFMNYNYWYNRSTSTFNLESNVFALFLVCSISTFYYTHKLVMKNIFISIIFYAITIASLVLTGSLTSIILVTIFAVLNVTHQLLQRPMLAVILILGFAFLMSYFSEYFETILTRQKISSDNFIPSSLLYRINHGWTAAFELIAQKSFIGFGPGALNVVINSDNDLLDKTVRYGVIGGMSYFLLLLSIIFLPMLSLRGVTNNFLVALYKNSMWLGIFLFLVSIVGSFVSADRFIAFYFVLYFLPYIYRRSTL